MKITFGKKRVEIAPDSTNGTPSNPMVPLSGASLRSVLVPSTVHEWGFTGYEGSGAPTNYSLPFARHPQVYRAITAIADAAGSVDLKLARFTGQYQREEITSGVEYDTLQNPNPDMSTDMLIAQTMGWMQMAMGTAFWKIVTSGKARMIVPISPERVEMKRDTKTGLILFSIDRKDVPASEIIVFKKPFNPYDDVWGIGPLQAAAIAYKADFDVRRYNTELVQGGGMPAGFVSFANGEWPTDEQMTQFKLAVDKAQKSGRKIIGIGGGTWQSAGMSAEEMAFLETRKLTFKEIGGVFGVPPSKLGDYERDQADAQVQKLDFWDTTMTPQLRLIADVLRINLWKINGRSSMNYRTDITPYFDFSEVPELVQRDRDLRKSDRDDLMAGVTTINDVRKRRYEPAVEWGDVWWKPMGLEPIDSPEKPEPAVVAPAGTDDDQAGDAEDQNGTDRNPDEAADPNKPPVPKKHAKTIKSVNVTDNLVWLAFILRTGGYEQDITRLLNQTWDQVERDVKRNLSLSLSLGMFDTKAGFSPNQILFDLSGVIAMLKKKGQPIFAAAQKDGGDRGIRMVRSNSEFDVTAVDSVHFLNKQVQRFAVAVPETTWNRLKDSLSEGFMNGETEREMTSRVEDVMRVRRYEAARTARTEASSAINGGINLGFQQSDVVKTRLWITAGDEHVRTEPAGGHVKANGQERGLNEPFDVGGEKLEFPGDPKGRADNVIECRCTIAPGKIGGD